jgi:hypothetical protein
LQWERELRVIATYAPASASNIVGARQSSRTIRAPV